MTFPRPPRAPVRLALALALVGGCDLAMPSPFKADASPLFDPTARPSTVDPEPEPEPDDGPPDDLGCADLFLGSAVGEAVSTGDTFGTADDHAYCDEEGDTGWGYRAGAGEDVIFYWVAPEANTYTFDTQGSVFDTMLTLYNDACDTPTLRCNDDYYGLQSKVTLPVERGEVVIIALDGYSEGSGGTFVLNINPGSGDDTGGWGDTGGITPFGEPTAPPSASLRAEGDALVLKLSGAGPWVAALGHAAHPTFGADACGIFGEDGVASACHPLPRSGPACDGAAPSRELRLPTDRSATPAADSTWFAPEDIDQIGVLLMSDPAMGGDGRCYTLGAPVAGFAGMGCAAL